MPDWQISISSAFHFFGSIPYLSSADGKTSLDQVDPQASSEGTLGWWFERLRILLKPRSAQFFEI
jgi:hypothetical protein